MMHQIVQRRVQVWSGERRADAPQDHAPGTEPARGHRTIFDRYDLGGQTKSGAHTMSVWAGVV